MNVYNGTIGYFLPDYALPEHMVETESTFDSFMDSVDGQSYADKVRSIREHLESLPAREADFIEMYYFGRLKQTDIAEVFKVSQPTVCYRLQRATNRLQYLLRLPKLDIDQVKSDLSLWLGDSLNVQIMIQMKETTCQSEVAKRLGVSQGLVRHRFLRILKRLRLIRDALAATTKPHPSSLDEDTIKGIQVYSSITDRDMAAVIGSYVDLFTLVSTHLNILREIQKPSAQEGALSILD